MSQAALRHRRLMVVFSLCIIFLTALTIRLGIVQLRQGDHLSDIADNYHYRGVPVAPKRGTIEDSAGNILAMSISAETVYAVPAEVRNGGDEQARRSAESLAAILNMERDKVYEKITKRTSIEYIKKKVTPEEAQKVRDAHLPGIGITEDSERFYPNGTLAAHLLGFVGVDGQGLEGIEYSRDEELIGQSGSTQNEYGADGIKLPDAASRYQAPVNGNTVRLSIDRNIQSFAERELAKLMSGQGVNMEGAIPKSASILAMEPKTGRILAIATAPTFDPNHYQEYPVETRRNIAVQNAYEPGSTFKIITLAAALDKKVVKMDEGFHDKGSYDILGRQVRCWKAGGHGSQTMKEVVQNSCNPGFVEMGQRLKKDNFYHYLEAFGFGKKTGIEMAGEAVGILAKKQNATDLDLATMSIGQTNAVTPIQLLTAVSAVANGGVLMKPQLVQEIVTPAGAMVSSFAPQQVRRVIDNTTSRLECEVLESVVTNGTGRRAFLPGYRVAGKTGTAQKVEAGHYIQGEYVASFVAFAPANDPQIAILCVVDGVPFYGGVVACPPVQSVMLDSLKYLGCKPDPNAPLTPAPPLPDQIFPPVKNAVTVPQVVSMSLEEGSAALQQAKLQVMIEGNGSVILDQIPSGNAQVEEGSTVLLYTGGAEASSTVMSDWWEMGDPDVEAMRSLPDRKPPE
ncbi:MAG: penicillin-binding transpeptidase domain-containing protein [Peptococcaceae bacterium]|nr:penicillin-binding transpeptidase domain-containing protein [Peptococcaceae bacterium]